MLGSRQDCLVQTSASITSRLPSQLRCTGPAGLTNGDPLGSEVHGQLLENTSCSRHLSCFSASPWPWKDKKEGKKPAMKSVTNEMTIGEV